MSGLKQAGRSALCGRRVALLGCMLVIVVGCVACAASVHAQAIDAGVVGRLEHYGKLSTKAARALAVQISSRLIANADRGGNDYDGVRQALGLALFGKAGPGSDLATYQARHAQVLTRLYGGLDAFTLEALFSDVASVGACLDELDASEAQCHALIAAALEQRVTDLAFAAAPSLRSAPSSTNALALARLALSHDDLVSARALYQALTEQEPDNALAFAGLGLTRSRLGDVPGAIEAYESAVLRLPNLADLQVALGRACLAGGRTTEAEAAFKRALELEPQHAGALAGLATCDSTAVTPPAANDPAEKVRVQARSAYAAGHYPEALALYKKALLLVPSYAGTYAGMGACNMALGDFAQAVSCYETATRMAPDQPGLHTALGRAFLAAGDTEAARGAFEAALSLDPNHPVAREELARLKGGPAANSAVEPAIVSRFPKYQATALDEAAVVTDDSPPSATVDTTPKAATASQALRTVSAPATETVPTVAPASPEMAAAAASSSTLSKPGFAVQQDDFVADLLADPLGKNGAAKPSASVPSAAVVGSVAPPTAATAPAAALPETPSREQIAQAMKAIQSTVKECVPDYSGVLTVRVAIEGKTGQVKDGHADTKLEGAPALCVSDALRTAAFPSFRREVLSVKFPFKL